MGYHPPRGADFMKGSVHFDTRAKRWFISIYWEGKQHRIWRHPVTGEPFWAEKSAEKQLSRIRTEVDDGVFNPKHWKPGSPLAFANYVDVYLRAVRGQLARGSIEIYRSNLKNHAVPFFQNRNIRTIRYSHLLDFFNHLLEKGLHKNTAGIVMDNVRHLFGFAHRSEDIPSVPPWPRTPRETREIEYLTLEQQEYLFSFILERHRPIFLFTAEFGLRIGEAIALQRDCVTDDAVHIWRTLSRGKIEDRPKARFRSIPMTEYARSILAALPPVASPFVFTHAHSLRAGMRYSHGTIYRVWNRALKKAGMKINIKNATRHSLGCQLLDAGVDPISLKQIFGHSSLRIVDRYARRTPAAVKNILEDRRSGKIIPFGNRSVKK
jgi:integrase